MVQYQKRVRYETRDQVLGHLDFENNENYLSVL